MSHKVREIYDLCNAISPFDTQETWDKSGLNLGSLESEFSHIALCLELTLPLAQALKPHTLVITHHPLFFRPQGALLTDFYPSNIAAILLRKNCSLLSLHTNFDLSHLNAHLTHKVLGWEHFTQQGAFMRGEITPTPLAELAQQVRSHLKAPQVSYTEADLPTPHGLDSEKPIPESSLESPTISEAYVICGSGCSLLPQIPPSPNRHICLLTGDVKHHDAMIAKSMGISLIDMGHYESEKYFVQIFQSILQNAGYNAIIADCKNPFHFANAPQ